VGQSGNKKRYLTDIVASSPTLTSLAKHTLMLIALTSASLDLHNSDILSLILVDHLRLHTIEISFKLFPVLPVTIDERTFFNAL